MMCTVSTERRTRGESARRATVDLETEMAFTMYVRLGAGNPAGNAPPGDLELPPEVDFLSEDVRGAMWFGHTLDQQDFAFRVVCPQRDDLLVRRRAVPRVRTLEIGELDRDQVAHPVPFEDFRTAAVDHEPSTEWLEGRRGCARPQAERDPGGVRPVS